MSTYAAFLVAGIALAGLSMLLGLAIVGRRWLRVRGARRRLALVEPFRPMLVALVVDDQPDPEAMRRIVAADRRSWQALEPHIIAMVRKLRGEAREVLVSLLEQRGTVQRLSRRLDRPGSVGRARAAELLGLLGEHAPRERLERLAVNDRDPEVRIVAVRALGEIGDPRAAPALLAAAGGPRAVPLRIAARGLARLGAGAAPDLARGLSSTSTAARAVSAEILGLLGAPSAATDLARAAEQDPSVDVRIRSARALGRIGAPSALPVLERCTAPGQPLGLRVVAAGALADVGGPIAVGLLTQLLDDDAHRVASTSARALGRLGAGALPALRAAAQGTGPGAAHAAEVLAEVSLRSTAEHVPAEAGVR